MDKAAKMKVTQTLVLAVVFALIATLFASPADAGPPPAPGSDPAVDVGCKVIFGQPAAPSAPMTQKHCNALEAMYNDLDGPNWYDSWTVVSNDAIDPCTLAGVGCLPYEGIVALELNAQGLAGALPPEIADLDMLRWLDLTFNSITSVPASIGDMDRLVYLNLSINDIAVLPDTFGSLTSVSYLSLGNNELSALPPSIGSLVDLSTLIVSGNNLTVLPPELSQLWRLRKLDAGGNQLAALPNLSGQNLHWLLLGYNRIDMTAGEVFATLSKQTPDLVHVDLMHNELSGTVPDAILSMSDLNSLQLAGNGCLQANDAVTAFMAQLSTGAGPNTGADVLADYCPTLTAGLPVRIAPWQDPRDPLGPIVGESVREPVVQELVVRSPVVRAPIGR